ncbi:hypothetical protein O9G_003894 [Rozella allomycis CSF55]|uniref:Uncharacterized protein n=1 Tax=Rozella allomycis (strain CSF55) TaxID=988480 RepID=A0A075B432_ROZAC|nr:hypothetical protein O9G_003894 [Rozella allomycis CSF55]|eukprot:EPZ35979.1 hypothetical protein O9G_003894 [Rozella allomycis CSF55]
MRNELAVNVVKKEDMQIVIGESTLGEENQYDMRGLVTHFNSFFEYQKHINNVSIKMHSFNSMISLFNYVKNRHIQGKNETAKYAGETS